MEQEVKKKKKKIADDNMAKSISKKPEVKKNKKKKSSPLVPILCLIIGILLGVIGTMVYYNATSDEDLTQDSQVDEAIADTTANSKNTLEEMLEEESFTIETPKGNLYYPLKWQERVRVEQIEDDVFSVNFYGTIGEKGEHYLFSIVFGGEEGVLFGTLNDTSVYIVSGEDAVTEEWAEDEKMNFYSMQEDVNYVLGKLQQEDGFVPAD